MIVPHWSLADWDNKRWPNFHPKEFACKSSGQFYDWPEFFDRIQAARAAVGKPFKINSAHRSWRYNLVVGGAPNSEHKRLAVDISLRGHDRYLMRSILKAVGFTGMGYYQTFIHADLGRKRFWYGGEFSKKAWSNGNT